jgi:hypothetical protein
VSRTLWHVREPARPQGRLPRPVSKSRQGDVQRARNFDESTKTRADKINDQADQVCAERDGTANIAWMEGRPADVVITCKDGTNHFYDG